MDQSTLIEQLNALKPALAAEGVSHLALFGSRARDEARDDSDIDLLVEIEPDARFSLLNLIGVEHIVSDATGLPVNAVMRRSLDEDFRRSIEPDVIELF